MNKDLQLVSEYDFNDLYELYDYIIDSKINGNLSQCKKLYNQLFDKKAFLCYIKENYFNSNYNELIESLLMD